MIIANLRATGTDPANPTAGELLGTLVLPEDTDTQAPPVLVSIGTAELIRFAIYAPQLTGFGPVSTLEYIEALPVAVRLAGA